MAGGQWEVVGGKTKKSKTKPLAKGAKDEKAKGDANFVVAGPISESQTIFNAFLEKEREKDKKVQSPKPQKPNEPVKNKERNGAPKKKKPEKISNVKVSLEDLFSSITEVDVKNHIATLEVLCPNSSLFWLKDIGTFFSVKLDIAVDVATFVSKPWGYPSSLLAKDAYKQVVKVFNRCTTQTLQIFHEHCLNGLVQDGLKGLHILGYCTMLQILAQELPSVAFSNFSKCSDLCNAHPNRQNICLLLWWAAGQVGNKDLETGFQVWLQLMFPSVGEKHCTIYAIEYLEELVKRASNVEFKKNIIDIRHFFPILDLIYSKELPKNVQKRLIAAYPTLKRLSFGHDPENTLRNYFPSYLRRLEPQCPAPLKSEILSSLVYCLEKDSRCFSVWRQLYSKHFVHSKLLIAHLNEQWETLPAKFPKRGLFDTLSVFQVTNEEQINSSKKNADVMECILVNKELLSKMKSSKYSWLRIIGFIIFLISQVLIYDIMTHNSFVESNVGKFMKDYGLLAVCIQAGEKLMYFYGKIHKLLETYSPAFLLWCRTSLLPCIEMLLKQLSSILYYVWNSTVPLRTWFSEQFPPLLEQIEAQMPAVKDNVLSVLKSTGTLTFHYITFAWSSAENIAVSLQSNAHIANFLDICGKYSSALIGNIQEYTSYMLQYAQQYVPWSNKE